MDNIDEEFQTLLEFDAARETLMENGVSAVEQLQHALTSSLFVVQDGAVYVNAAAISGLGEATSLAMRLAENDASLDMIMLNHIYILHALVNAAAKELDD